MELTDFQKATVKAALRGLRHGAKRFLVADEVGLGKTVVAREVLRKLATAGNGDDDLTVFYFANSLGLRAQNRRSLARAEAPGLSIELIKQDRLGLAATLKVQRRNPNQRRVRLFVLTPLTSLPGGRSHIGRRDERTLALAFFFLNSKGITRSQKARLLADVLRLKGSDTAAEASRKQAWKDILHQLKILRANVPNIARVRMIRAFSGALDQALLRATNGPRTISDWVQRWHAAEKLALHRQYLRDFVDAIRMGLCCAALARDELRPGLIILDEFQKYRELLYGKADGIAGRIVGGEFGSRLLLLSATPFEEQGHIAHQPLSKLVKFLYGNRRGPAQAAALEQQLKIFIDKILKFSKATEALLGLEADIIHARDAIESILLPVIARTERRDDPVVAATQEQEEGAGASAPIAAEPDDILTFDDFVRRIASLGKKSKHLKSIALSQATPLWLSVPYPVATLPIGYKAGRAVAKAREGGLRGDFHLRAPNADIAPRQQSRALHHPKLRALAEQASHLQLPWLPPSLPWWPLAGAWAEHEGASKSLVFTHFRAAPPAVAALVSRDVERQYGPTQIKWSKVVKAPRKGFSDKHSAAHASTMQHVLFHPWRCLVTAFDPATAGRTRGDVHIAAVQVAQNLLASHQHLKRGPKQAPLWQILAYLEGQGVEPQQKLEFNSATIQQIANLMQGGPGVVVARAVYRYVPALLEGGSDLFLELTRLTHGPLRTYLTHQYFQATCGLPRQRFGRRFTSKNGVLSAAHDALIAAVLNGNLESSLDETIAIWLRIGAASADKGLIEQLAAVLHLHAGSLQVRPPDRRRGKPGRLRAHVALALTGQETDLQGQGGTIRPEALRIAFNSPFWPHILTTTSIGQEGLDLHVWCREIVHWDPPPDALALEQREGRITRYGGLVVRQCMAQREGSAVLAAGQAFQSPWASLMAAVEQKARDGMGYTGLAPWWVYDDASIDRISLAPQGSEQQQKLRRLRERLDLYRLALGQPHAVKEALADRLAGEKLPADKLRQFAIDLSAARLRRRAAPN